jgi:hypothetical protein
MNKRSENKVVTVVMIEVRENIADKGTNNEENGYGRKLDVLINYLALIAWFISYKEVGADAKVSN